MVLSDSGGAIGAVTSLLRDRLETKINKSKPKPEISVIIGRPKQNTGAGKALISLSIYEIQLDPAMKNTPYEGIEQPVWLVLKFLITAYDTSRDSDSSDAYAILSRGIQALQELSFLEFGEGIYTSALENNPEPLKITFDNISPDLVSKLIQGTNEIFRVSAGFQIRPVLIVPENQSAYPMLVGFDNTENRMIGKEGIHIDLFTLRQQTIKSVYPAKFEAKPGLKITLSGCCLDLPGLSVQLGPYELPIIAQQSDQLTFKLTETCLETISAGSNPVSVIKTLPNGRRFSSNMLNVDLIPVLENVSFVKDTDNSWIELKGTLLGGEYDDIIVVLSRGNVIFRLIDTFSKIDPQQKMLKAKINVDPNSDSGTYRVTLRVNGQQAAHNPEVNIT